MADQYKKRVDSTQLPSATELLDILTKESQRKAVRFDFVEKNNAIFDIHHQLSLLASSDDSWIDQYQQLSLEDLMLKIDSNHSDLATYIKDHQTEQGALPVFLQYTDTQSHYR